MKILQVNKFYYPEVGGVETVVKQYAESMIGSHDITVLCVNKKFGLRTKVEIINGVTVIRSGSFGTFFSMPVSLSFYYKFLAIYKQYDIIHFHEPFPLASLLSVILSNRLRIVVTWHSDIIKQKKLKRVVEYFQDLICAKASLILTTSPNLLVFSRILSRHKEKVKILPLSIPVTKILDIPQDRNYILYLGRLSYYKGINILLEAMELSNTQMELIIVGNGEKRIVRDINQFITTTKKKIKFENKFVTEDEKEEYIRNCSFFVLPSIEASEAFAIVQLEAMIQKKAVVNTNLPTGVPYVSVHNETGITVPAGDAVELAKAIDKLAESKELRDSLGTRGHERVIHNFSDQVIFDRLLNFYSALIR